MCSVSIIYHVASKPSRQYKWLFVFYVATENEAMNKSVQTYKKNTDMFIITLFCVENITHYAFNVIVIYTSIQKYHVHIEIHLEAHDFCTTTDKTWLKIHNYFWFPPLFWHFLVKCWDASDRQLNMKLYNHDSPSLVSM